MDLDPGILIVMLVSSAGALAALGFAFRPGRRTSVRCASIVAAAILAVPSVLMLIALHPELIDARYRPFKAFYADIRVGMTRDDVFGLVDRRYPSGGQRLRPIVWEDSANELTFFMNSEGEAEPNCEGVLLDFEEGKVSRKRYSAD